MTEVKKVSAETPELPGERNVGVPVSNGLTNEWHPTHTLADYLTMHERTNKPYDEIACAFVGDGRFNVGPSRLITGAITGSDVRHVTPAELRPPQDVVVVLARELVDASAARITITDDLAAVNGVDSIYTKSGSPWGAEGGMGRAREAPRPLQVSTELLAATDNPKVKFMHYLPAIHDAETTVGREIAAATGTTAGLEVTDEVFRSPASIVFHQAEKPTAQPSRPCSSPRSPEPSGAGGAQTMRPARAHHRRSCPRHGAGGLDIAPSPARR